MPRPLAALAALLALAAPAPLAAETFLRDSDGEVISVITYLRDSDGEVIAVAVPKGWEGHWVWRFDTGGGPIAVPIAMPVAVEDGLDGDPAGGAGGGQTGGGQTGGGTPLAGGDQVEIDGRTYAVERVGADVWLRDAATGARIAGTRVARGPDAEGRRVNPRSFALD